MTRDPDASASFEITTGGILASIAVFAVAALCVRLGFWQLDRLDQRVERNRAVAERLERPPLTLDRAVTDTAGLLFRRVALRGSYDHDRSVVLAGRSRNGVAGIHLLTPLRLDGGGVVLVNRGWLPAVDAATVDLEPYRSSGSVEVHGVARAFPRREDARPPDGFRRTWFRIDGELLRAQYPYPVAPFYLRRLADAETAGPPVALDPPALDRGPHLSYALQWFSFAAIAVIGWLAMLLKSRKEGRDRGTTSARSRPV